MNFSTQLNASRKLIVCASTSILFLISGCHGSATGSTAKDSTMAPMTDTAKAIDSTKPMVDSTKTGLDSGGKGDQAPPPPKHP